MDCGTRYPTIRPLSYLPTQTCVSTPPSLHTFPPLPVLQLVRIERVGLWKTVLMMPLSLPKLSSVLTPVGADRTERGRMGIRRQIVKRRNSTIEGTMGQKFIPHLYVA